MNRTFVSTAVALGLLAFSGHAQEKQAPPDQIRKFESLVGTFEGDATMTEGGKAMKGKVRHTNTSISGGWGFMMEEAVTMEDGSTYRSQNIIGYDAGGGKLHVFSVTNAGETHDHKGSWTDPKTAAVQYEGKWEGKPYIEKASLILDGPDSYRLRWSATHGGKAAGNGEETLRRVK